MLELAFVTPVAGQQLSGPEDGPCRELLSSRFHFTPHFYADSKMINGKAVPLARLRAPPDSPLNSH